MQGHNRDIRQVGCGFVRINSNWVIWGCTHVHGMDGCSWYVGSGGVGGGHSGCVSAGCVIRVYRHWCGREEVLCTGTGLIDLLLLFTQSNCCSSSGSHCVCCGLQILWHLVSCSGSPQSPPDTLYPSPLVVLPLVLSLYLTLLFYVGKFSFAL